MNFLFPQNIYFQIRFPGIFCSANLMLRNLSFVIVKFLYVSLFLCIISFTGRGEEKSVTFDNISVEDGLSSYFVNCIMQDSRGFMWFGTKDGLNRYDGYNFVKYFYNSADSSSVSHNFINSICEDPSHKGLWIGTQMGLNFYSFQTESFTSFYHQDSNSNSLSNNIVTSLVAIKGGGVWVGTPKGLDRLIPKMDISSGTIIKRECQFIHYNKDSKETVALTYNNVSSLYSDRLGDLWIGYVNGGLDKLIYTDGRELIVKYPNYEGGEVTSITDDNSGNLWITNSGTGLVKFDRDKERFYYFNDSDVITSSQNWCNAVCKGSNGALWVGNYSSGLMEIKNPGKVFNKDSFSSSVKYFHNDPDDLNTIIDNWIRCLYMDASGVLWAGTRRNGIVKVSFLSNYFMYHCVDSSGRIIPDLREINSIIEDSKGILRVGTATGLISYDPKKQILRLLHSKRRGANIIPESVFCMCEDTFGAIWLGTFGDGLYRYDINSGDFTQFSKNRGYRLQSDRIMSLTTLKSGDILLSYEDGGVDILEKGELIKSEPHIKQYLPNLLPRHKKFLSRRKNVFEDSRGNIWITTVLDGLYKYDPREKHLKHYEHKEGDVHTLSDNHIASICEDKNGVLWIATDKGLDAFDVNKEIFTNYYTNHGLPDNTVIGVLADKSGDVWALTRKWISRLDPVSGKIRNFNYYHRVVTGLFCPQRICETQDGKFFVGTQRKGFFSFCPDSIADFPYLPPVVITDMKISGTSATIGKRTENKVLLESINQTRSIILKHFQNNLTFEFSALSYLRQDENRYACKLEGAQDDWQFLGANRRSINFFNLLPGKYILKVKASNYDGVWNENFTSVKIVVLPPWWRTLWAYSFYIIVFMGLLFAFYRYTSIWLELKNKLKFEQMEKLKIEELNKLKLRFFTNISHEFRTPLTLIVGPLKNLIARDKGDAYETKQYMLMHNNANRLLRLINQLMDFRKVENKEMKLKPEKEDIVAFTKRIVQLFEELANQKEIKLEFTSDLSSLDVCFDRDKIDKVLFNLLSNAIKYTPKSGSVSVLVESPNVEEAVKITVEDSGVGISEKHLPHIFDRFYQVNSDGMGTGIGLALVKSFVEMHQGTILAFSQDGAGTRFELTLPLVCELCSEHSITVSSIKDRGSELSMDNGVETLEPVCDDFKKDEPTSIDLSKAPRILVVEDDSVLRGFICDCLASSFGLMEAGNGREALEIAIKQQPDLIISDVMMPEMDGLELCRQIKKDPRVSHIPMILLTALDTVEDEFAGYKSGAEEYIPKPFNPQLLVLRVKNLISLRNSLKERFPHEIQMEATELTISAQDEKLLEKVMRLVEENLMNSDFTVEQMGKEIGISRVHLYRKIKVLTNQTVTEFIRTIRLKRAAQLVLEKELTVSEVAYQVGFSSPAAFGRSFKKHFGVSPSEYSTSVDPK